MATSHCERGTATARRTHWVAALGLVFALGLTAPAKAAPTGADGGSQALFNAIRANDLDTVKQIVEAGADPLARDAKGQSAPQAAVHLGYYGIAISGFT